MIGATSIAPITRSFVWRNGQPREGAVRVTYSLANDQWPDLFIDGDGSAAEG